MAYFPPTGSVVAFQNDPSKLVGTVSVVGTLPVVTNNASVVAVLTNSSVAVLQGTDPWKINVPTPSMIAYQAAGSVQAVGGTVTLANPNSSVMLTASTNHSVIAKLTNSSVTALQGTNPWFVNMPSPSVIAYQEAGSVMAVSGSFTTGNSSVQVLNDITIANPNASVMLTASTNHSVIAKLTNSSVTALQGTNPWIVNMPSPSMIAYQAAGSIMAVNATVEMGNSSVQLLGGVAVIGSVATLQGTDPWLVRIKDSSNASIITVGGSSGNSSVQLLDGVAVIGSVAVLQGTSPWLINMPSPSVVAYQAAGSIQAVSGTITLANPNSSVMLTASTNHSVIAVLSNSSVAALQGTNPWIVQVVANSIVGTYPEDSAHTTADRGIFTLGVRNDMANSIASADLDYTPIGTDSFARTVIKPFAPDEAVFRYVGSVVSGSVTLIAASVIGKHHYITDWAISNTNTVSSVSTLITFQDGSTSFVGRTIAPAGGGSNKEFATPIRTVGRSQDLAFAASPAASIIHVTITGYTAP